MEHWYSVYGKDEMFEKFYAERPHLERVHRKAFKNNYWDEYLKLANQFQPLDLETWRASLGELYQYEKELYAKVDKWYHCIIVSYYNLESEKPLLFMRFIFDTSTSRMYHYRLKQFKTVGVVLNCCDGRFHGNWTDMDRFYTQCQRKLDPKSLEILKSINFLKYLPIEKFKKISVYNLFQVTDEIIYQWEILIKIGCIGLATDLHLNRQHIRLNYFKMFKNQIHSGIRWKKLYDLIIEQENKEWKKQEKVERRLREEMFAKLPKKRYDLGEFILRHPKTVKEIVQEGRELHHCVATYVDKIIQGETDVMFLRKKSEPDKPFFTVEIQNYRVIQCRTDHNQTDPEITKIVQNFLDSL